MNSQEEHMEDKVERERAKVEEIGEHAPQLHVRERRLEAKVELQRRHNLALLHSSESV